jgi:hypothetical protein
MAVDGRRALLFLLNNGILVYDGDGIERLDIPTNIVRDLEIIDKSSFDGAVDAFIKTRKLPPANLWIILSDKVSFSKDIPKAEVSKMEEEAKNFLDAIPFDEVISKKFNSQGGGVRVIATNSEVIDALEEIFARNGFVLEGVVPSAIFTGFTGKPLDEDFAKFALENEKLMIASNMLQTREALSATAPQPVQGATKKTKLLPYLLIGFGVLLVILVISIVLRS